MTRCTVEWYNNWPVVLVQFPDHPGRSLLMQSDYEYVAFCFACGAPIGCGDPSSHEFKDAAWDKFDITTIEECPDEYLEAATAEAA